MKAASAQVLDALHARLRAIAPAADVSLMPDDRLDQALSAVLSAVRGGSDPARAWLVLAAISGTYPDHTALARFRRVLDLTPSDLEAARLVLAAAVPGLGFPGRLLRHIEPVDAATMLVDVTFCATNDHNTGIQRVVRSTMPHWIAEGRPVRLVRWAAEGGGYVDVSDAERRRVLEWGQPGLSDDGETASGPRPLLIPLGAPVFLPEVPAKEQCSALACLASSVSTVSLIGYDTIPIGSAAELPRAEAERFGKYLDIVKRSRRVLAISHAAADEFSSFVGALPSQGLEGPDVQAVPLAVDLPPSAHADAAAAAAGDRPLMVCVGSHEPRKNQDAVLFSAERLFREGLDFEIAFVGGGSRAAVAQFDRWVGRLRADGMRVTSHRGLPDEQLWGLMSRARFSVFLSKHEGYGLPVAESLVFGTPVLASNYGSVAEVAQAGGCELVDPRDDEQILAVMRRMLGDDELIVRLREEAAAIEGRSWREYAAELWGTLQIDGPLR